MWDSVALVHRNFGKIIFVLACAYNTGRGCCVCVCAGGVCVGVCIMFVCACENTSYAHGAAAVYQMQLGLILIAPAMSPEFGIFASNDYEGAVRIWYIVVSLWFVCHEVALQRRRWRARHRPGVDREGPVASEGEGGTKMFDNPLAKAATRVPAFVKLGATPADEADKFDARHGIYNCSVCLHVRLVLVPIIVCDTTARD